MGRLEGRVVEFGSVSVSGSSVTSFTYVCLTAERDVARMKKGRLAQMSVSSTRLVGLFRFSSPDLPSSPPLLPPSPSSFPSMATAPPFLPSSDVASSSDPPSSKRHLVPSANGEGEGQMSKKKKARTSDAPPPSFPDATLVPINSLKAQTWTKEDLGKQFIRGEVAQVSKWREETQMAKM